MNRRRAKPARRWSKFFLYELFFYYILFVFVITVKGHSSDTGSFAYLTYGNFIKGFFFKQTEKCFIYMFNHIGVSTFIAHR